MTTSTDRILTTHVGSLPRPADLDELLYARDNDWPYDADVLETRVRQVTAEVVNAQLDAGIDLICDGEVGKIGYSTYVRERLTGFGGESSPLLHREMAEYPGTVALIAPGSGVTAAELSPADRGSAWLGPHDASPPSPAAPGAGRARHRGRTRPGGKP